MSLFVLAVMAGTVVAVLALAKRLGRLVAGAASMLAVLAALWAVALLAVSQDWRDADGFVDCKESCSPEQEVAGVVLIWAPILVFLLLGVLLFARFGPTRKDRQPWS